MNIGKRAGWTVTGVAAAAVTLGVGTAVATGGGGDDQDLPGAITLQDRVPVEAQEFTPEEPGYEVVPRPVFQADSQGNFDSLTASMASPDVTATAAAGGAGQVDVSYDSPDDTFNSPDDTFDSPDSADSPDSSVDSYDSPDNSD